MEGASAVLRVGGRRLLQDCNVLGSVGVGGSIAILLLVGFVAGAGATWLLFWLKERRQVRIELEYRNRFGDALRAGLPDVSAMVKAATTPTIAAPPSMFREGGQMGGPALAKAASAMTEGPLGVGVGSFKHDPLRSSVREHANPVASSAGAAMARSSSGNPFTEVSSFNVVKNEICSLNNSVEATPARAGGAGLIGTAVYGGPASDPASPRIVKQASGAAVAAAAVAAAPVAASNPSSTNAPFAWPAMDASTAGTTRAAGAAAAPPVQVPQHTRSATVVGPGAGPSGAAVGASAAGAAAGRPAPSSCDYLAALDSAATNPFETPALRQQEQQREAAAAAAKAAAKHELLRQVSGEEYGEEELDPEWAALLADLNARLQAAGRPPLSSRERAVAIRSLIVATASQSADAALDKALTDVEAFRRAQSFRAAA